MALALALSVLSSAGAQAVGSAAQTTTPERVVLKSVQEDKTQAHWPYVDQVLVLEKNENLKADSLPKTQQYVDETGASHPVDLKWEVYDMDLKKAGLHEVSGAPVLTKDQTLAEGFDGKVTYPVFRKGTDALLEAKALQQHGLEDILIAKDSKDPLSELTIVTDHLRYGVGKTGYILSDDAWKWEWDVSKVDTSVTGKATVTGTLKDWPDWVKLAGTDRTAEHTVYVMPTDRIELYAPTDLSEEGKLTFQWLYDSTKVTKAVLEMEKDGKWTACQESWYTYQKPAEGKVEGAKDQPVVGQTGTEEKTETEKLPAALILDLTKLPAGADYTFRLNYVDETTGKAVDRSTESLTITIPENIKKLLEEADGKIPTALKINEKPAVKPEPEPEPEPDDKPEVEIPKDIITDTYTTLSGKSLAEKIAKGDTVSFEKKGVTLVIPSKLLADLKLKDTELLTVSLTLPKTGTVQVVVNAGGKVITNLKGSVVKMSYTLAKNKTLTCKDLTGKLSPKVTYTASTKTASFPINQAGTYTLTAKTVTTTTNKKTNTTKKNTTTNKKNTTTNKNTNKTTTAKKYNTPNKSTTNRYSPSTDRAEGSLVSGNNQQDEDSIFLETGTYEEEPFFFEDGSDEDDLFLEEMEDEDEDAPRTLWDEQTPVALALMAVMGLLTAAGLLLRKWFSE